MSRAVGSSKGNGYLGLGIRGLEGRSSTDTKGKDIWSVAFCRRKFIKPQGLHFMDSIFIGANIIKNAKSTPL